MIELFIWAFLILIAFAICILFWFPSRIALVAVFGSTLLAITWASHITWLLRDGLAPGFIPSTGMEALSRFGEGMLFPAGVCVSINIIAIFIFLLRRKK